MSSIRLLLASLSIYILSLFFPAFWSGQGATYGFSCLVLGWMGFFTLHIANYCWLANPVFLIGIFAVHAKDKISTMLATIAMLVALSFPVIALTAGMALDEAGTLRAITGMGAGYGLWLSSMVLLWLAARRMKQELS